jgi:hypothetical protein
MTRPVRVATICHNDDDHNDPRHRRVRLELTKENAGYVWRTDTGEECCTDPAMTVHEAKVRARDMWGADVWALRATWL